MKPFFRKTLRILGRILLWVGIAVVAVYVYRAFSARSMPSLEAWHEVGPAEDLLWTPPPVDLNAFVEREQAWLDEVYAALEPASDQPYSRYTVGGLSWPVREGVNLNGSFVLRPDGPVRGGALLVHGLLDSPYHMRAIAQLFADSGLVVLGLRMPGHGTQPGALTRVRWPEWYAAVEGAANLLEAELSDPDLPRYFGGFSTGGALVLRLALERARDGGGVPDGLFLFAPAVAVSPGAAVVNWHGLLSWIPYFDRFAWLRVQPEYDPYKYNSFHKNAADQVYLLTLANSDLADEIAEDPAMLERIPPMLAVQSAVDATVRAEGLADLFARLAPAGSELVLFDLNRTFEPFFRAELRTPPRYEAWPAPQRGGRLLWVRNRRTGNRYEQEVELVEVVPGTDAARTADFTIPTDTVHAWPDDVYAISHVATPIAPNDPVYGRDGGLGGLQARGERQTIIVADNALTRLPFNPFFGLVQERIARALATGFQPDEGEDHVATSNP